ncbi:MAG TPA: Hsp70 family protein, partial [Polyangiaceae bacterium]|nr:Hsp70 family protein [Polyangiaceae bacterium]
MSAVIGIDLGTTNTVVAAVRDGRAMALPTETGERLFPSVVSFHPNGSVLVGREAKRRRLQDAANTVYSTKRLIGRSYDSEEVRKARSRSAFVIQEGPGRGVLVEARGETYTLSEISAFVLKEAKRIAESTGEVVDRAVITVPANFNDLQRAATKVAGHIAGLEVQRILNEPTAAALAYGYGKGNQERIAVFDFGGGTFDVTLLDLAGSVFEVLATAGDTFLGGDDIDLAIAERMAERYLKTHRYDARADRQVFERLLASAEEIKIRLSASDVATVQLQEIAFGVGGKSLDMPFSMTRLELEQLAAPLVDRALGVCREAMGIARLTPQSFDQVIVVGGTTRLPLVRRKVGEFFGRSPLDRLSADEVVALGAAIQALALSGQRRGGTVPLKSRQKITDPGLGGQRSSGVGMIAAPVVVPSPSTQPLVPDDDIDTAVVFRAPEGKLVTRHGQAAGHKGSTAPGLAPAPIDPGPVPLPLIEPDRPGFSTSDEDPTEIRVPKKNKIGEEKPVGMTTARMPSAPPQPPPPPVGITTARMPSAPPQPPPPPVGIATARMPSAPVLPPPVGITTARMPSAPPQPPPAALEKNAERLGVAAAAVGTALSAAQPSPSTQPFSPPRAPVIPSLEAEKAPSLAAPQASPKPPKPTVPLLIDVTPLSLVVHTVGDFCDVVIERNTPIPCERTRLFTTATDNQTMVRVSVAQGESKYFSQNTTLGQVELTGLRAAGRGEVSIAVTFEIDADGILNVRAKDQTTG